MQSDYQERSQKHSFRVFDIRNENIQVFHAISPVYLEAYKELIKFCKKNNNRYLPYYFPQYMGADGIYNSFYEVANLNAHVKFGIYPADDKFKYRYVMPYLDFNTKNGTKTLWESISERYWGKIKKVYEDIPVLHKHITSQVVKTDDEIDAQFPNYSPIFANWLSNVAHMPSLFKDSHKNADQIAVAIREYVNSFEAMIAYAEQYRTTSTETN